MELTATMTSEESRVCDVLQSDPEALNGLIESIRPKATALAYTLTGNREDALDAVQNALTRVFARPESRTMGCPVIAAVYQSVHSAAVDIVRRRAARQSRETVTVKEQTRSATAMQDAERRELVEILRNELSELPAETAAVITLHHMDDLPVDEVSRKTGLTVDACKHRLSRGREQLRQRLERRGVALASLAMMAELLHEAFLPGKACAAELASSALAQSQATAAANGANTAGTGSSGRAASKGTVKSKLPAQSRPGLRNARGKKAPDSHSGTNGAGSSGLKSKVAVAAIVIALIAGSLPFLMPRKNATPAVTPTNGGGDVPERPKATPVVSRWQAVEIGKDRMVPIAFSADQDGISLLTTELAKNVFEAKRAADAITIRTSNDGGQKWNALVTLKDYSYGTFVRGKAGQHLGVALINEVGFKITSGTHANSYELWNFTRADWITVASDGKAAPAVPIWKASTEKPLLGTVTLIRVNDVNWVFGRTCSAPGNFTGFEVLAAVSKGTEVPKPVKVNRTAPATFANEYAPAAWATDERSAGFITRADTKYELIHTYTTDAGKTWRDVPIPFTFDSHSDTFEMTHMEPIALARDENRLVVLFSIAYCTKNAEKFDGHHQEFTVISDDLGRTWKTSLPVGAPVDMYKQYNQTAGLQIHGDELLLATNVLTQPDLMDNSPRKVTLQGSWDAGATWNEARSLDIGNGSSTDGVLLLDGNGLYLAARQISPESADMLPARVLVHRLPGSDAASKDVLLKEAASKESPNF